MAAADFPSGDACEGTPSTAGSAVLTITRRLMRAGRILKGVVGVGVLLPAEIARPGTGQLLGGLMRGVENRFSRDQERDADRVGLAYARAAGYDSAAALRLLDALQAAAPTEGAVAFFDIHPPYPERRALLEDELRAVTPP